MDHKRLVLLTNMQAHYQLSLGRAFAEMVKPDFAMVCWGATPLEQKTLGWEDGLKEDWLINAWVSLAEEARAIEMVRTADVVVWGDGPASEIIRRGEVAS
jgi:hypothetical protein